jgi:DNA-binding FrmR family transcriptional regulator
VPETKTFGQLYEADRKKLIDRLARVEGQLRGIQKMISRKDDCESIAQQMAAARGAMNKAFADLIACAVERRLADGPLDGPEVHREVSEVVSLLTKYG